MTTDNPSKETVKNLEFLRPQAEILGLKLRPYAAGTEAQMEQMRYFLRQRLNSLTGANPEHLKGCSDKGCDTDCPVTYRSNLATYYYLGMFLFIHGADKALVDKCCWDSNLFFPALTDFLQTWRMAEVLDTLVTISAIIDSANNSRDYKIDNGGMGDTQDPNGSRQAE